MKIVECLGCGLMIGANDEDALCDKCIELDKLRSTVLRYEKALKECIEQNGLMEFLDENDWATQEDYFVKIAKEALYK